MSKYSDEFKLKVLKYYNNVRIRNKLKGMSPVKYRQHSILVA